MRAARFFLLNILLFTALTGVMTYPQYLRLSDSVHDDGDPLLNTWALAWVAHQLPYAPARLFDANIFYPDRRTLAYSETLVAPGIAAAPLAWVGVGPILVHNIVFLSGLIVSGAGMALLLRELTGSAGAAVLGGIVFAFLPYRIDHYSHLQLQQTQCLPLIFWAFHRLLRSGRLRDGVLVGLFVAGQILSCVYYGLFLVPYMAIVCGVLLLASGGLTRQRAVALCAAATIAVAAAWPVARAYLDARKVVGERPAGEVALNSATWQNYLAPSESSLLYGEVFQRFMQPERRLFPGFAAVLLAGLSLVPAVRRRLPATTTPVAVAYVLGLLVAFDLSLGFNGISYRLLYDYALPFRALRIPARMGLMVGFSLAVLAGVGIAGVASRLSSPTARRVVVAGIGFVMLLEYASKPLDLMRLPIEPPAIYKDVLKDVGDDGPATTLFEFPASPLDDPTWMYYSAFHWQNLVNGYSGFFPPAYIALLHAVGEFPDARSLNAIRAHNARYIIVHGERLYGDRYRSLIAEIDRRHDLTLVARRPAEGPGAIGEVSAYRVDYSTTR